MTQVPKVYFGSVIPGFQRDSVSLTAKLDKIIELLDFSKIDKRDKVAIKMHLGLNVGYQTLHPLFVRRVVEAVKKTGAYPFITDNPTAVYQAAARGYTAETCGCPIIPIAGIKDRYTVKAKVDFMGVEDLDLSGVLNDSDAMIVLTHVKGHGNSGLGGAFKNIAVGGFGAPTRWHKIHPVVHYRKFFDEAKVTPDHAKKLVAACPRDAIEWNEKKKTLSLEPYVCDQCHEGEKACVKADAGKIGWQIRQETFDSFQEMMAVSAKAVLDTFNKDKLFYLNFMLNITPFCDCTGFGMPNIVPDIGVLGSKDIVAIDQASLDLIAREGLEMSTVSKIPERYTRINKKPSKGLHPFQVIHGPMKNPYRVLDFAAQRGMGSREYELIEVLSVAETQNMDMGSFAMESGPTFF